MLKNSGVGFSRVRSETRSSPLAQAITGSPAPAIQVWGRTPGPSSTGRTFIASRTLSTLARSGFHGTGLPLASEHWASCNIW